MNENNSTDAGQHHQEQINLETSDNSNEEKPLTDQGINETLVQKIRACIDSGKLSSTDVDNRVCEQLRSFPDDSTSIDSVFDEFQNSDLTGVVNKSAFLCQFIKQWKLRNPQTLKPTVTPNETSTEQGEGDPTESNLDKHKPGPDEAKLKVIVDRFHRR